MCPRWKKPGARHSPPSCRRKCWPPALNRWTRRTTKRFMCACFSLAQRVTRRGVKNWSCGSEVAQTSVRESGASDFFELTTDPIDVGAVARRVVLAECGATVTLDGYAREWTRGRRTLYLVYEAYAPMALSEMRRLGEQAHEQLDIAHLGIVHRTGRLEIGETSIVIASSAPHRRAAFAACEWAIQELKRTVPIWKKEVFEDGEVWVEGEGSHR